jgi:hypothetical protein
MGEGRMGGVLGSSQEGSRILGRLCLWGDRLLGMGGSVKKV